MFRVRGLRAEGSRGLGLSVFWFRVLDLGFRLWAISTGAFSAG